MSIELCGLFFSQRFLWHDNNFVHDENVFLSLQQLTDMFYKHVYVLFAEMNEMYVVEE